MRYQHGAAITCFSRPTQRVKPSNATIAFELVRYAAERSVKFFLDPNTCSLSSTRRGAPPARLFVSRNMGTNDEILRVVDLKAFFRVVPALHGITMSIRAKHSTAIIGPSGCGKFTLVRCLNRMHEVIPGATVQGEVWFNGFNIYDPMAHPV